MKFWFLVWVMDGWWYFLLKRGSFREVGWEERDKVYKGGLGVIQEEMFRKKSDMQIWGKKRSVEVVGRSLRVIFVLL